MRPARVAITTAVAAAALALPTSAQAGHWCRHGDPPIYVSARTSCPFAGKNRRQVCAADLGGRALPWRPERQDARLLARDAQDLSAQVPQARRSRQGARPTRHPCPLRHLLLSPRAASSANSRPPQLSLKAEPESARGSLRGRWRRPPARRLASHPGSRRLESNSSIRRTPVVGWRHLETS
jgi:hypothetical protein